MSFESFIPEIWAGELLSSLKKSLVYAGPDVVNRDYEGDIAEAGDTVTINSISRPTIGTYVKNSTSIVPENLTTAQRKLTVTEAKYFAFEVDNVDLRQMAGDGFSEAISEAGYGLGDVADQYVEALIGASVVAANALGTVSVTTGAIAYTKLIALKVALDVANVPDDGRRYVIVPPWYHGLLLDENKFVANPQNADGGQALMNGHVGRAAGFNVKVSNNSPLVTGDDYRVTAGHPIATSYAEQINSLKAYEPQDAFSDAVKGLHLYGAKVVRPTAVATMVASIT